MLLARVPPAIAGVARLAEPFPPHHRLAVDRTLGALHLRADLILTAPWTLLFGPSGSGKTSLLRAACGLLGTEGVRFRRCQPAGRETSLIGPQRALPPHQLGLSYAPQQGALFPHLTVLENVSFPLTVRGEQRADRTDVEELLELFDVTALRDRTPQLLSGGERQRVNLARAFAVPDAHLFLLDEPFAGMGRALRDRLLARMQAWMAQRGLPVLSVSHDVDEALLLGAEVIVLEEGRVLRQGPAAQALADERERTLRALQI
jgi:molybdate transport system ATP-binding protein